MKNRRLLSFGPVPSRRLGKSLGVNNIPPKNCSYSCVYCQLGKTVNKTIKRHAYYRSQNIIREVNHKINETISRNEKVDFITFVPDGEPTLDINLKKEISLLKQFDKPIAVITNSSLLWLEDVREDLLEADLVSIKVDTVNEKMWKKINRPHKHLKFNLILEGIQEFSKEFTGIIVSETMLMGRIDYRNQFQKIAEFLGSLPNLNKIYIAIPTRPPAEKWVIPPTENIINRAYQEYSKILGEDKIEYLIGYEGNAFAFTGSAEDDLLSIISVHPMRKEAVKIFLKKANTDFSIVEKLLDDEKIVELEYEGMEYYLRKLSG